VLFRKNIEKSCSYCVHAAKTIGSEIILCSKKGMMPIDEGCKKFKYDPLKRNPVKAKPKDFSQLDDADFSL